MTSASESLPSELSAAHAMILAERAARVSAETRLVVARAEGPTRWRISRTRKR